MLPKVLKVLLLLEVLVLGAVVVACLPAETGWMLRVLAALGLALLWRAIFVLIGFLLAGALDPRPAGWGSALAAYFSELAAMSLCYGVLFPFFRCRDTPGDQAPVLLLHGYLCTGALWWWFRRALERRGHRVISMDLLPLYRGGPGLVADLERALERAGLQEPVFIIGHSMGGLLARLFAQQHPARVLGVVALGAPHFGTRLVRLLPGFLAGPPGLDEPWLQVCNRARADHPSTVPLLNVLSVHDNIVVPQTNARLPKADNRSLAGLGHLALPMSPRVRALCLDFLERNAPRTTVRIR